MTLNDCVTLSAASYCAFPGCDAVIRHWPPLVSVTWSPEMVQAPPAEYETARPEDAVAFTVNGDCERAWSESAPNVMYCVSFAVTRRFAAPETAARSASPGKEAAIAFA